MPLVPIRRLLPSATLGAFLFVFLVSAVIAHAGATLNILTAAQSHTAGCDYLIITDSTFTAQAQRLAKMRKDLTPIVATQPCIAQMADIYRNHPPQGPKWTSVKDFLKAANAENQSGLAHVVLLGDASLHADSPDNHVPTYTEKSRAWDSWSGPDTVYYDTLISDDAYASFFDSNGYDSHPGLEFAIGRIPARTAGEADAYLDKVQAYEGQFAYGPQAFTYGFFSDDDLQRGSMDDLDPISLMPEFHQEIWDGLRVKPFVRRMLSIEFPIQADGTKPAAKDSTLGLFNAGPARVYFISHGSNYQLTDEKIFEVPKDLARLRAKPLQPIVCMLSSTTAKFAHPESPSMGEQMLFHPHGAVAFLGGTMPTFPRPNNILFMRWSANALLGGTLGRTFAAAKDSTDDSGNNAAYVLLGDPALTLPVPALDLVPAPGSGAGRLVLQNAGASGDSAYFQLVRIDSLPFNDVIHPLNGYQKDRLYIREVIVAEGRAALGAGGSISFTLPSAGDPKQAAVKVMTWSKVGMRYGHFALESLGQVALNPVRARVPGREGYRLMLRDGNLVLEGNGRRVGLDGRNVQPLIRRSR
ncbi:MAG: C25 family cysteine peptidase [Fibrobacterota bacterium]|nr:C25 family cysteine peptidase [Fibrobacterota bacterium]